MDIHHSPNFIGPTLKFWEILDQITNLILTILDTPKVHKVVDNHLDKENTVGIITISITEISKGAPSCMHSLVEGTTRGTHPLHTYPLHP